MAPKNFQIIVRGEYNSSKTNPVYYKGHHYDLDHQQYEFRIVNARCVVAHKNVKKDYKDKFVMSDGTNTYEVTLDPGNYSPANLFDEIIGKLYKNHYDDFLVDVDGEMVFKQPFSISNIPAKGKIKIIIEESNYTIDFLQSTSLSLLGFTEQVPVENDGFDEHYVSNLPPHTSDGVSVYNIISNSISQDGADIDNQIMATQMINVAPYEFLDFKMDIEPPWHLFKGKEVGNNVSFTFVDNNGAEIKMGKEESYLIVQFRKVKED